jgi:hypothetical protein
MISGSGAKMALEKELQTYKDRLPELKAQEGKYVLIQGDKVIDTFTSYEDAMKEGYAKFGLDTQFLVKQIRALEQVQFISRLVTPCRSGSPRVPCSHRTRCAPALPLRV